jgi:hypothetical protein
MSRAYSSEFDPPAILTATLSGVIHSRPRLTLPALIDTGADMTAVPETAVSRLRLSAACACQPLAPVSRLRLFEVGRITVEDIGGRLSVMDIYTARLSVDSLGVQEMEVAPSAAFCRLGPRLAAILLLAAQWAGASV